MRTALADEPVLAMQRVVASNFECYDLRTAGLLSGGEYVLRVAGDCMGEAVNEGGMLVADPERPVASEAFCLIRVRGDTLPRGKIYLSRLEAIAGAADNPWNVEEKNMNGAQEQNAENDINQKFNGKWDTEDTHAITGVFAQGVPPPEPDKREPPLRLVPGAAASR